MASLQDLMVCCNPFVNVYCQVHDIIQSSSMPNYSMRLDFLRVTDWRRYNTPHAQNELATIIPGDVDTCINSQQIIVWPKGGSLIWMTECHPSYVALHFPLLAPTGQKGWSPDMTYRCLQPSQMIGNQRNCLTLCDYLQYCLVTSGRLVWLDLSPFALTVTVSGSNVVQLVLKPLSESLGRLVLLIWIGVCGDGVGL